MNDLSRALPRFFAQFPRSLHAFPSPNKNVAHTIPLPPCPALVINGTDPSS